MQRFAQARRLNNRFGAHINNWSSASREFKVMAEKAQKVDNYVEVVTMMTMLPIAISKTPTAIEETQQ